MLSRRRFLAASIAIPASAVQPHVDDGSHRDIICKCPRVADVKTGFIELDDLSGGFSPGTLTVMAGRPSVGKTTLACEIALYGALIERQPLLYCCLDESPEAIPGRMACSEAHVDRDRYRCGRLTDEEMKRLREAEKRIAEAPIYVRRARDLTTILESARRYQRDHGARLVVVDGVETLAWREPEMQKACLDAVARHLKNLAIDLKMPVLALVRTTEPLESRPTLKDVPGKGLVEAADSVWLLNREEGGEIGVNVALHRGDRTGRMTLGSIWGLV